MSHLQITIPQQTQELQEIIIAQLQELGFEGFEEDDANNQLHAYIPSVAFKEDELKEVLTNFNISFTQNTIEPQNWNAIWESNFSPIIVDSLVGIRAEFHPSFLNVPHQIIITPKMSFGTGHHNTTYMVIQLMSDIDFKNKEVYDFGTGTGILAIYAAKLGAKKILAVDNDDWCIENSIENCANNNCPFIEIKKATAAKTNHHFDVVLANINLNIIRDNLISIANSVKLNGVLLVSGIMVQDEVLVNEWFSNLGFKHYKTLNKDKAMWIAMGFIKG